MATRQNASTRRTRQRLHDACLRLAERQDISSLTINQIAEEAGLNRTTFYLHYPDSTSLIEAAVEELFDRLDEAGHQLLDWEVDTTNKWEEIFFHTIAERPHLFARLLSGSRDDAFVRRFLEVVERGVRDIWEHHGFNTDSDETYLSVRAKYVASGVLGMTVEWLESEMPVDSERICRWSWEFLMTLGATLKPAEHKMDPSRARKIGSDLEANRNLPSQ